MLANALRRFVALVGVAAAGGALLGLLIALAGHEAIRRGLALGFYVAGVCLCGLALLLGSSPPVRGRDGGFAGFGRWVGGGVRWASRAEHDEAINLPAVLLTVGVVLILIGVGVDHRPSGT